MLPGVATAALLTMTAHPAWPTALIYSTFNEMCMVQIIKAGTTTVNVAAMQHVLARVQQQLQSVIGGSSCWSDRRTQNIVVKSSQLDGVEVQLC